MKKNIKSDLYYIKKLIKTFMATCYTYNISILSY